MSSNNIKVILCLFTNVIVKLLYIIDLYKNVYVSISCREESPISAQSDLWKAYNKIQAYLVMFQTLMAIFKDFLRQISTDVGTFPGKLFIVIVCMYLSDYNFFDFKHPTMIYLQNTASYDSTT